MGRLFTVSLEGKIYTCKHCGTHLALHEDVVGKFLEGRDREAYLFIKVANVTSKKLLDISKMTGLHAVAVIFCIGCGAKIGWTFECSPENSQRYKEGKCVLQRSKLSYQGPDGGSSPPWPTHEARVGSSDADDDA